MQQLTQKLKDGAMCVHEVPVPALGSGTVLVRNLFSLVSAGTEGSTVKAARSSLIEKAKQRPQQVKQVLDVVKSQGPVQAWRAVMKKLDAYSPLGYSCVGTVQGAGCKVQGIKVGDWVACAGVGYANHAEVVSVPENLCVKLRPDTDLKQAAYNTLGAIAMQGVRQADVRLGESCAVIGLGLLGQLACLLLRASGVRVAGVDIDPAMVAVAGRHCADLALVRSTDGIEARLNQFAGGAGFDAVIIAAATDSLDPINFAGAVSRKRGTVVVVGAVPTGFEREPHYYRKELQVKMSCSYGPGRYDPTYEEKGIDYPFAYVRWTEKRNMEAFQELIHSKRIDVGYLTTHTFRLADAAKAYDMILARSEPFIGILIEYDAAKDFTKSSSRIDLKPYTLNLKPHPIGIGFIGAGSYAQSHLLPNLTIGDDVALKGVMTASGTGSRSVGERFGFQFCTGDEKDILENPEINTVFIASRHDSHAGYVLKALAAGKHVFVEKPLCLTIQELEEIAELSMHGAGRTAQADRDSIDSETVSSPSVPRPLDPSTPGTLSSAPSDPRTLDPLNPPILMVGYNRRFSPFARRIKETLGSGPMAMTYRVNAGAIPKESWIQDPEMGGGRVIGEVCHFVDFLTYINGSLPVSVFANMIVDLNPFNDTLTVSLKFANGSIGTIGYFGNGDKGLPKERLEVFGHGCAAVLDDFKRLTVHANGRRREYKLLSQDKGQKSEVQSFTDAVRTGGGPPIPYEEILSTSWVTFKILESMRLGQAICL
jgi:polar amino acid transport system substrate-binding protein